MTSPYRLRPIHPKHMFSYYFCIHLSHVYVKSSEVVISRLLPDGNANAPIQATVPAASTCNVVTNNLKKGVLDIHHRQRTANN
jgi:hypothetical protein